MKIYLAGGMRDGWQDRIGDMLRGHELLDPRSWSDPDPATYTQRDLQAIDQADVVLCHMDSGNPSGYGLSVELGYAAALKKRVVFVDNIGLDWRSKYFGMHREMATIVVETLEDACQYIRDFIQ